MAIARNPHRNTNTVRDTQAENFISGAGKQDSADGGAEDSSRKPIMIRIPVDLLKRIDEAAKRKSITRSSFIVSSMADLVNGDR